MGFFRNINCIRKVICDIRWDMTVIRDQLKIINETIIDKPEDSDRVKLLEEQVDCLIKNNFKDGKHTIRLFLYHLKKWVIWVKCQRLYIVAKRLIRII